MAAMGRYNMGPATMLVRLLLLLFLIVVDDTACCLTINELLLLIHPPRRREPVAEMHALLPHPGGLGSGGVR